MKRYLLFILSFIAATFAQAQLSGTYTINVDASQNPDYPSFSAAATALSEQGISGPVIFEVAPGTYNEYVTLPEVAGASETNRITFVGVGADNQQTVLTGNAGYTNNAMLTLNGTDYVTFENLTITSTSTVNAVLVKLLNGNVGTRFQNLKLIGAVATASLDNEKDLVYRTSGSWIDLDNAFVNCEFINGYIGLYYQGHNIYTLNDGLLVENCVFTDQAFKGIYVSFTDHAILRGNTVTNHTHDVLTNYHAIDLLRIRYHCIIENNVINVTRHSNYATLFEIRPAMGTEEEPVIIRNNTINLHSFTNSSYCVDLDDTNSNYVYFLNNTVKCDGPNACGSIIVEKSWPNLYLYNNLIVNETGGYVFRFQTNTTDRYSDYNRIQYNGENLARIGTEDYASLAEWSTAGMDVHSALCTPQFVGDNDLHVTDNTGLMVNHPLEEVPTDIDGEPRSSTPCAGADEYVSGTNLPPVVQHPIANVVFEIYPASQTVDLSNTFTDPDDPDEGIVIELVSNSNPTLVSAVLNNRMLTLQRLQATGGSSTITLRATSNDQWVETSFTVECVAEDLPPVVANPLDPIHFTEFPQSLNFNLTYTFDDPDNNNSMIEISVLSCPSEVTALYNSFVLTVIRNTPSAFDNKVMVLRATSNGKTVDMEVLVSGDAVVVGLGTATFEDVTLNADGLWQAPNEGDNTFISGGWSFTNYYSEYFWGGFTVSNHTDLTQSGMDAQYTAAAEEGHDGSAQYATAYTMGAQTVISSSDGSMQTVSGCYVTNNVWAYQNMLVGDYSATPFGGTTGNDPDWFKLTAIGKNANGQTMGTLTFYLADYRFENHEDDYVLNTWEWFDLSMLGPVASITFSLSSSKNNAYGMITPAYFCMDDFNGIGPETPDQPPFIANPVADVVFDLFPQILEVDLDGVASDPDNDDAAITYSLITNSNPTAISATLSGKTLTLNRLTNEDDTADLTLRAFSNGQSVDFNIHVILHAITDFPPVIVNPVEDVIFDLYPQTMTVNLDGVAYDPDDPMESITYSLVTNSNPSAVETHLNGKLLTIERLNNQETIADLTMRAFSDGQHVDFNIHVVLYHYVGTDEIKTSLTVFPNPTHEFLMIKTQGIVSQQGTVEYHIYNLMGQLVLTGSIEGEITTIDLGSIPNGTYFVTIRQAGGTAVEKIVIY